MPPAGTPSPFRFPSQRGRDSASARSTARRPGPAFHSPASYTSGSQFAATPRFVLSQKSPDQVDDDDDIDTSDRDEPSSPSAPAVRPTSRRGGDPEPVSSRRKDVIEDSEDEGDDELPLDSGPTLPSDPQGLEYHPGNAEAGRSDIDSQFDMLFPPTVGRSKRRRVSADPDIFVQRGHRTSNPDPILSSSPEPPSPSAGKGHGHGSTPLPSPFIDQETATPAPHRSIGALEETPRLPPPSSSTTTKTPFRSHPRFVFSASQPSSRPSPRPRVMGSSTPSVAATETSPSVPERKKPAFVLPRSPSPSKTAEDPGSLPTPFSPSLRRGRSRQNVPDYLPGGMAAEVRSWVLEMAVKREHQHQRQQLQPQTQSDSGPQEEAAQPDLGKYFLTAEIESSRCGTLHGPGSVSLVRGRTVHPGPLTQTFPEREKNILLFGPPTSRPGQDSSRPSSSSATTNALELNPNNVIGIHCGLIWEIELSSETTTRCEKDKGPSENQVQEGENVPSGLASQPHSREEKMEKWLVGMEWDLLR
ncbi:hypothetical protein VTN00DRAFT_2336 [Thermoascus crustaceus]|uniref:uncharacterized protein n=1 Tax=Thermoascus crustaceus TaxID=5088 RepID=UPI003742F1AB